MKTYPLALLAMLGFAAADWWQFGLEFQFFLFVLMAIAAYVALLQRLDIIGNQIAHLGGLIDHINNPNPRKE